MFTMADLMAYLMPMMSGDYTTDNRALTLQDKQYTNANDLMKMVLSPQFAMLTGTYDPTLLVPQQPVIAPFDETAFLTNTQSFQTSGNPVIAEVASGLLANALEPGTGMDPMVAKQKLQQAMNDGQLTGFTPEQAYTMVDTVQNEIGAMREARMKYDQDVFVKTQEAAQMSPDNPFAAAGLPNPLEQYDETSIPMDETFYSKLSANQSAVEAAEMAKQRANQNANAQDVSRMADNDRAMTTADNRNRKNDRNFENMQEFNKNYAEWQEKDRYGDKWAEDNRGRVGNDLIKFYEQDYAGDAPTLSGNDSFADRLVTQAFLKMKKDGEIVGTKPKPVEPKLVAKPKKTQDQIKAGSMAAMAQSDQARLQGQQWGEAFVANQQGRSPFTDAFLKRMLAMGAQGG